MKMELTLAAASEKEALQNLLEKYLCEFSQWDKSDVDEQGLYGYPYLDCYFTEENRWPYLIWADGKLAGFILVSDYPEVPEETDFCLSEFFILYKYRRCGIGKQAAFRVFDCHRGRWQLKRHPHNTGSVFFWNRVVDEYTGGNYTLIEGYPNREVDYDDGTPADVFLFDNQNI